MVAAAGYLIAEESMQAIFPFTAIVGQDKLKTALVLNAISPKIGGVLIRPALICRAEKASAIISSAILSQCEPDDAQWSDCS